MKLKQIKAMASSSSRTSYRSLEDKCTTLVNLNPDFRNWFVKVLVSEKTPIRFLKWGRQQKLVFVDKKNGSMHDIIYDQDVEQLDILLQLYKTYYIENAKIKEITSNTPIFASAKYQMLLSKSTYIKLANEEEQLPIDHAYQLTSFVQCPELADVSTKQINLLCSVVHVFLPRFVEKTKRNLQEFVIVNEERRPSILTLWEEFLQTEAPFLAQNVHTLPVILGMRLSVNTFYGILISI
ncbi:replication protein A 70 kDa DNA-binding subunit B-like [Primulina huaijiensis]|uniref:replication protein A 70 kDa DNA-binding subunit B-like n=1 Tax=Primulina huaijiensis TaxID=1492673 RepID=UPI003CC6EFDF